MAIVIETVADVLARAGIGPGDRLLVGYSGGVDSTVLLHALAQLRGRFSFELLAHHVHHGLSPNADAWSAHCEAACRAIDVPCTVTRVALSRAGDGLEAAARAARHRAWAASEANWWVTAHHQGDQTETVLFRLLRGAGVAGAAAMAPVVCVPGQPGRLRPLLDVPRACLVEAARASGLRWVEDESNTDTRYSRNFLRQAILPHLRARFPGMDAAFGRAASHFAEAAQMLDELAQIDLEQCGERPMARPVFLALSPSRQANMLRHLLRKMSSRMPDETVLTEVLRQVTDAHADRSLTLRLGDVLLHAYRNYLWLTPPLPSVPDAVARWSGQAPLIWGEGEVRMKRVVGMGLDAALIEHGVLSVRCRWPGCAMRLRNRPMKALKQLAQEAGVPPVERSRLPVVCLDGQPIWIARIGESQHALCPAGQAGVVFEWVRPDIYRDVTD